MDEEVTVTVYDGNKVVDSGILASIHTDQHGGGLTTWHGQFKQTAPVAYGRSYLIETNDGRRGRTQRLGEDHWAPSEAVFICGCPA